ncbi:hypothetical protein REV77_000545 [Klebsiella aerogenes]|uniref:hypothetical protein n=1 Tax=Klebsiella aerogenes TaxID=548 RepID=UPI000F7F724A|nr:hypothetical protein [Klebsiella aerogenes]EKZ5283046.1 hypothetical protein [Klebsiella aerogenes]EKZ6391535.1 hypothetical protein [Klebsiella aerogenes]RSW82659.1 hypothetical protein EGH62_12830 [Klebsiella aerogenes]
MPLPIINQFLTPYEVWETRAATQEEAQARMAAGTPPQLCFEHVKIRCIDVINSPDKAAYYLAHRKYDNEIDRLVEVSLNDIGSMYKDARSQMPSKTPAILSGYQRSYGPHIDMYKVNIEVVSSGAPLADGQILFHGGGLLRGVQIGESLTTTRPLSTSLSPCMATRNGEWRGKFYHENEANLIILTACSMTHNAFIFKINGTDKGHEKEVLIQTGAVLKVVSRKLLNSNYKVYAAGNYAGSVVERTVPFYLTHVIVS